MRVCVFRTPREQSNIKVSRVENVKKFKSNTVRSAHKNRVSKVGKKSRTDNDTHAH